MVTNRSSSRVSACPSYTPLLASLTDFQAVQQTFPQILAERARAEPDAPAFCRWNGSDGVPVTWAQCAATVRDVALGLDAIGVDRGDRVAIMSPACVEWVMSALGILSIGAIPVGVYPTSSAREIQQTLGHSEATVVIVSSGSDAAKIAGVAADLTSLRVVVGLEGEPAGIPASITAMGWDALCESGRARHSDAPDLFDGLVAAGDIDQPAALFYTSGSTGTPKGVTHTHRTLQYAVLSFAMCYPQMGAKRHDLVGFLGLSHVAPALIGVFAPLMTRLVITYCSMEERRAALIGVRPTAVLWPPRMHEKLLSEALAEMKAASAWFRVGYRLAMKVGRGVVARRWKGEPVPWHLALLYRIALRRIFLPLRAKVGVDRLEVSWTASGAMTPEVTELWQVWGLDLRELFGTTETCGTVLAQWDQAFPPPGTVGKSLPDPRWMTRATEEGELLIAAPLLFRDYWGDPTATAEAMDGDWYRTGDLVDIHADGEVKLIGRLKDVVITSGGKTVSPQPIEVRLKASPLIEEAVVVGDGRKYLTVLIWPSADGQALGRDALTRGVHTWIAETNSELARPLQLKDFRVVSRALSQEGGELTAKGTIRRSPIVAAFASLIDEMYALEGHQEFARQAQLTDRGRRGRRA